MAAARSLVDGIKRATDVKLAGKVAVVCQIKLVRRFLEDLDYEAFRDDQLRFHAVTRCLEIISEASRRLPEDLKARHPSILLKEMAGAGNVYRNGYESVEVLCGSASPRKRTNRD